MAVSVLQQSCLYFCHHSVWIFTSTSCNSTWGKPNSSPKRKTITTPRNKQPSPPMVFTNSLAKSRITPLQSSFTSEFRPNVSHVQVDSCKLLKWMFTFGGLNHNFSEAERTPQFLKYCETAAIWRCSFRQTCYCLRLLFLLIIMGLGCGIATVPRLPENLHINQHLWILR